MVAIPGGEARGWGSGLSNGLLYSIAATPLFVSIVVRFIGAYHIVKNK